jgi:hypothetical protein
MGHGSCSKLDRTLNSQSIGLVLNRDDLMFAAIDRVG